MKMTSMKILKETGREETGSREGKEVSRKGIRRVCLKIFLKWSY